MPWFCHSFVTCSKSWLVLISNTYRPDCLFQRHIFYLYTPSLWNYLPGAIVKSTSPKPSNCLFDPPKQVYLCLPVSFIFLLKSIWRFCTSCAPPKTSNWLFDPPKQVYLCLPVSFIFLLKSIWRFCTSCAFFLAIDFSVLQASLHFIVKSIFWCVCRVAEVIHHFRINRSLAGWAHSQRRVGVNITIPLHWPSCEWTLTLPIFLVFVRYQQ